jgi:hypothetical protein
MVQGRQTIPDIHGGEGWPTLYNGVGSVKRHVSLPRGAVDTSDTQGFDLLFVELLVLRLLLLLLIRPKARFQNRAVEALVPPTIYPVTDSRP